VEKMRDENPFHQQQPQQLPFWPLPSFAIQNIMLHWFDDEDDDDDDDGT